MSTRRLVKAELKSEVEQAMKEAEEAFDRAKKFDRKAVTLDRRALYLIIGLAGKELGKWNIDETRPGDEAEAAANHEERTRLRAAVFAFADALRTGGLMTPSLEELLSHAVMPVHEMLADEVKAE